MNARLYEVTTTVLSDGYTVARVYVNLVAAETRRKAIKIAEDSIYLLDSNAVVTKCVCVGGARHRLSFRRLEQRA